MCVLSVVRWMLESPGPDQGPEVPNSYPGNIVACWCPGPSVSKKNKMAVHLGGNFGYVFSVEEANRLIEDLEIQSTAKFACFKATKDFGSVGEWDNSYNK